LSFLERAIYFLRLLLQSPATSNSGALILRRLLVKIGDLVIGTEEGAYNGSIGIIFGFDEDDDPIVSWCNSEGSNESSPGCGEYREHLEILNASR